MKYFFLLSLLVITCLQGTAQVTQTPLQVIGTTGGYALDTSDGSNFSLSYTVGEISAVVTDTTPGDVAIPVGDNNFNYLTQGFQQPEDFPTGLIDLEAGAYGSFVVYPNPAVDYFYFGFEFPVPGQVSIVLYDELGQRIASIFNMNYANGKVVNMGNTATIAAGSYLVSLIFTSASDGVSHVISDKLVVVK
jgi:hypothetical protein